MIYSRIAVLLLILAGTTAMVSCRPDHDAVEIRIGSIPVRCEIADTSEERAKGLMFRKKLDENNGMLFVFDREEIVNFWMKNTSIPLSIAYISSHGEILEIFDLVPYSERPVPSRYPVRFALEVNRGFFDEHGIEPGERISFPDSLY